MFVSTFNEVEALANLGVGMWGRPIPTWSEIFQKNPLYS